MKANLKQTHKKQLKNAVKNLSRIIKAIREYIPEANIFIENGHTLTIHQYDWDGHVDPNTIEIFYAGEIDN